MGVLRWDFGAFLMWGLWGGELQAAAQCPEALCPGGSSGVREQGRRDSGAKGQFSSPGLGFARWVEGWG